MFGCTVQRAVNLQLVHEEVLPRPHLNSDKPLTELLVIIMPSANIDPQCIKVKYCLPNKFHPGDSHNITCCPAQNIIADNTNH
jgi:hypothetical protein